METRKDKNAHKDDPETDTDSYSSNSEEKEDEEMGKQFLKLLIKFSLQISYGD